MITTGSKLFFGLSGGAALGAVLYGLATDWGSLGVVGLLFAAAALAMLGVTASFTRDATVAPMDTAAIPRAAVSARAPGNGIWPPVGALGAGLVVLGLVTDKRYFVGGIVVLLVTAFEWLVQSWAEQASDDPAYNAAVRGRILHPLEFPILAALGLGVVIFGFSRVMLSVSKDAGPAIFATSAAAVLAVGALLAYRPGLSRSIVTAVLAAAGLLVVAGGVAGAVSGERGSLAVSSAEDHFANRECGVEATEADRKGSGSVAAKSNVFATFTLRDDVLSVEVAGQSGRQGTVYIPRSNPVNIIFRNDDTVARRLVGFAGTRAVEGQTDVVERVETCTLLTRPGEVQFLTVNFARPSDGNPDEPFSFSVPGVFGATIGVVVP